MEKRECADKTASELFAKKIVDVEQKAIEELNESVAAEVKQIKRRTATAMQMLQDKIKAADNEINACANQSERSDNAFANSQKMHESASKLNELKQNEFIEKAKLKKQEADSIAALSAKAKIHSFKNCKFIIEYLVR